MFPVNRKWPLLILGSKGQRSRSQDSDDWKWFPGHILACIAPKVMKLANNDSHESRMTPIDFGVKRSKVKVTGLRWLKVVSGPYFSLYCNYNHEACQKCFPWIKDDHYQFWGSKVKGQGHRTKMIKNGFPTEFEPVLHL